MKFYIYLRAPKIILVTAVIFLSGFALMGCQKVETVERDDSSKVIQEEFTQSAVPLTDELADYSEIDEFFIEDETGNALEQQVRKYLTEDKEVKSHHLNSKTMDLKLYMDEEETAYFLAVMKDEKDSPNTLFGILKKETDGTYKIVGEHLAAYFVNLPKTYLLTDGRNFALVSQRAFSTFEECYFYMME